MQREKSFSRSEARQWLKDNGVSIADDRRTRLNSATKARRTKKPNSEDRHAGFRIVVAYSYTDETGRELFQVCRMENGEIGKDGKREKTFIQRRPDNNGGYINGVEGVRQVPYRLRELLEAIAAGQLVFSVEGEKCVDALIALGLAASCNAGGANKWPDEITPYFRGADIVTLPDNDAPGKNHARLVASKSRGTAKRVRVLELPGLPPKGDVYDWLAAGHRRDALLRLVEHAPESLAGANDDALPEEENSDAEFNAEIRRVARRSALAA